MARARFNRVSIKGISTTVPQDVRDNAFFSSLFSEDERTKMETVTGIQTRHVVTSSECTSDLCEDAARKLLDRLGWEPETVDALLFVTQTPDYILPATACILQHKLGLSTDCAALDINLGCSGYVYGLWQASALVESGSCKRVLLLVGDTCTKFCAPEDKSTVFLFGDAGTATALEYDETASEMAIVLGSDGEGGKNLIIPVGGYREQVSEASLVRALCSDGNTRSPIDLYMHGGEIFNFTIQRVPKLFRTLCEFSDTEAEQFDMVLFHQANMFMLKHLAKKMKLDPEKVPFSIGRYGNTSSASIPLTLTDAIAEGKERPDSVAMFGFGVGYSWAGLSVRLKKDCVFLHQNKGV